MESCKHNVQRFEVAVIAVYGSKRRPKEHSGIYTLQREQ